MRQCLSGCHLDKPFDRPTVSPPHACWYLRAGVDRSELCHLSNSLALPLRAIRRRRRPAGGGGTNTRTHTEPAPSSAGLELARRSRADRGRGGREGVGLANAGPYWRQAQRGHHDRVWRPLLSSHTFTYRHSARARFSDRYLKSGRHPLPFNFRSCARCALKEKKRGQRRERGNLPATVKPKNEDRVSRVLETGRAETAGHQWGVFEGFRTPAREALTFPLLFACILIVIFLSHRSRALRGWCSEKLRCKRYPPLSPCGPLNRITLQRAESRTPG